MKLEPIVIHVQLGSVVRDLWCDDCLTAARWTGTVYLIGKDGVSNAGGTLAVCDRCTADDEQEQR